MPIRRLLTGSQLGADEIEVLTRAFEQALHLLSLVDRDDPLVLQRRNGQKASVPFVQSGRTATLPQFVHLPAPLLP